MEVYYWNNPWKIHSKTSLLWMATLSCDLTSNLEMYPKNWDILGPAWFSLPLKKNQTHVFLPYIAQGRSDFIFSRVGHLESIKRMFSVVNISSKNLKYIIKLLEIKNVKLVISSFSWKTDKWQRGGDWLSKVLTKFRALARKVTKIQYIQISHFIIY